MSVRYGLMIRETLILCPIRYLTANVIDVFFFPEAVACAQPRCGAVLVPSIISQIHDSELGLDSWLVGSPMLHVLVSGSQLKTAATNTTTKMVSRCPKTIHELLRWTNPISDQTSHV